MIVHDEQISRPDGLKRVLGPIDTTCVVIGSIIGVGIFFSPSQVAAIAGSANLALLAWAVGGGIALLGALTFAELGGLYPRTGGQYIILRDAYGPLPGFLYVFCNATAVQAGAIAVIGVICARNLGVAIGHPLDNPTLASLIAALLIIGLVTSNILGVKWGSRIQNITVFAKIITLLTVTVLAMTFDGSPEPVIEAPEPNESPRGMALLGIIFAAIVPAFFAFGGWQQALWIGGEVRNPRRNVPFGIITGVLVVVILYLLANWAYLTLLGHAGVVQSKELAADAVSAAWPAGGGRVIAGAVAISAFGVLNAQFLAGPRLIYGLACDGRFFRIFRKVDKKHGTPLAAIILLGAMALVLLFAAGENVIGKLTIGVVFIDGVFFALTGAALIVLRMKRPNMEHSVRMPLFPLVPGLFVLGEIGILTAALMHSDLRAIAINSVLWIAVAGVLYVVFFRKKEGGETKLKVES